MNLLQTLARKRQAREAIKRRLAAIHEQAASSLFGACILNPPVISVKPRSTLFGPFENQIRVLIVNLPPQE